jgi:hypothetical protein
LLVEGWQLSRALKGRLRRDGAIVELKVDTELTESPPMERRLGGWCEMTTSLGDVSC